MRQTTVARNLSLMRSVAIFLYERHRHRPKGQRSLPDWQKNNHRHPSLLITLFDPHTTWHSSDTPRNRPTDDPDDPDKASAFPRYLRVIGVIGG